MTNLQSGKIQLTLEEFISTLKHSSLPTLIIEGKDDLIVFRKLESKYQSIGLSILPAGGRNNVLGLFDRESEFSANKKIMFIADQDVWIYKEIPKEYQSEKLIFTTGYSIENDIIAGGKLENLMDENEQTTFQTELKIFSCWYANALSNHFNDDSCSIDLHPNEILDDVDNKEVVLAQLSEGEYPKEIFDNLLRDYVRILRGKSLLGLLMRQLSYKGRIVRHQHKALIDNVAHTPNELLEKFYSKIESVFATPS